MLSLKVVKGFMVDFVIPLIAIIKMVFRKNYTFVFSFFANSLAWARSLYLKLIQTTARLTLMGWRRGRDSNPREPGDIANKSVSSQLLPFFLAYGCLIVKRSY
jgi:hypothetical protein